MQLLTTEQAAATLGISPSSVRRLTLAGVLKCAVSPSDRVRLYRPEDVERARTRPVVGNPNFVKRRKRIKR